jgi:phosphatidate cytidylyltransferase
LPAASAVSVPAPAERGRPAAPARWADLRLRAASAIALAALALGGWWLGGWAWRALVIVIAVGLAQEWLRLWRGRAAAAQMGGLAYIALGAAALAWLRDDPSAGRANVLFVLVVVWASDIGAYLAGRLIGGPRLAPRISPGKTWSGAAGGLAAAGLAGWLVAVWLGHAPPPRAPLIALVLGLVSQAGDLGESAAKRFVGAKDSGALIPGHGGLLDRLDGLLAAAPLAALLALWLGRGVVLWQ